MGRRVAIDIGEALGGADGRILVGHANAEEVGEETAVVGQGNLGARGVIADGGRRTGVAHAEGINAVSLTGTGIITGRDVRVVGGAAIDHVAAVSSITAEAVLAVVTLAV
jgi:hypothetical protein